MSDVKKNNLFEVRGVIDEERVSTQCLLTQIYDGLDQGETDYDVYASGQHNIGGALWHKDGKPLNFTVVNPGQRLGSMGMVGTSIISQTSAPADVGWLNAGAEIVVKGDGGDTTAHCAASGKIYVGGRVGTRSGALMKYDPAFTAPELWVLKSTGSFSFEFMGGGKAIVCGYGCEDLASVLGYRSCAGMVGGTVYVRGNVADLTDEVYMLDLTEGDVAFLTSGLKTFVEKIERPELYAELSDMSQWRKIVAKTYEERVTKSLRSIRDFRLSTWVEGGIFGDVYTDDFVVAKFVETRLNRLRKPEWMNANYSAPCEYNCPSYIPTQKRVALLRQDKVEEMMTMVLDYSPFPGSVCGQVCPNLCMDECNRRYVDVPVKMDALGLLSKTVTVPGPTKELGKKVAIIGSGASGLTSAWHLRRMGYTVDVFEADSIIGGKLKQVIPAERLNPEILDAELKRIEDIGVNFTLNTKVDKAKFAELTAQYDAVVAAVGAHNPVMLPIPGNERILKGLDFLKEVNKGEKPKVGEKVVVIGAGNAAMDVVIGAYEMGAKKVTAIDIQKPMAFDKEIEHAKKLGADILWPVYTDFVDDKGVHTKDGKLIEADTIIISIGDRTDFSFFPAEALDERGRAKLNEFKQLEGNAKVFVPGDAVKPGLFTDAIGDGRKVALNIHNLLEGRALDDFAKAPMIPSEKVKDEFYHPMLPQAVAQSPAEDEAKRCMSCGYCRDCEFCMHVCPQNAISRIQNEDGTFEYKSDCGKCIGCGICAGVCPCGIWTMKDNLEKYLEA